jgi:hypothetical protein
MSKAPVTGIVAHVSKRGTEVRLNGDPKRYRGVKLRPASQTPDCKTTPVFKYAGVQVGDEVYLKWGGFADMNIVFAHVLATEDTDAN